MSKTNAPKRSTAQWPVNGNLTGSEPIQTSRSRRSEEAMRDISDELQRRDALDGLAPFGPGGGPLYAALRFRHNVPALITKTRLV